MSNFYRYIFLGFLFIVAPAQTHASVSINEMSWMGDNGSSYCEWFELYNTSSETVDLANWHISVNGVDRVIEPSLDTDLTISPHAHYVIGRDVGSCADYLSQISDVLLSFALTDGGFTLEVRNGQDQLIDTVTEATLDWSSFKEQNSSRDSLQWTGDAWVLAANTPGSTNYKPESPAIEDRPNDHIGILRIQAPDVIYRGLPIQFTSISSPQEARDYKSHEWNFGDLATSILSSPTHTYTQAGTFRVHLSVKDDGEKIETVRDITVREPNLSLTHTQARDVIVQNTGTQSIPLDNMRVVGSKSFTIPKHTTLLPGSSITVQKSYLGATTYVVLKTPSGEQLAELMPASLQTAVQTQPASYIHSTTVQPKTLETNASDNVKTEDTVATSAEQEVSPEKDLATTSKPDPETDRFPFLTLLFFIILGGVLAFAIYSHRKNV